MSRRLRRILLHLHSGRSLGPSEVRGIVNLTAAAVPGLTPDHVAVVTTDGQMLKKPRAGTAAETSGASDDEQAGEQRALEVQLEDRARSMLEKVVGPGHVDVRVTAELDPARVEHVEDRYDPARSALRSEEETRERSGVGLDDTVAGVPGAESNLPVAALRAGAPPAPATTTSSAPAGATAPTKVTAGGPVAVRGSDAPFRESHTRNFELDHVSDKRIVNPGALKRIGVAVILDGVARVEGGKRTLVPRDRAELDRFSGLVRSAVGASEARGDSITVESVPFEETTPTSPSEPVPTVSTPAPRESSAVRAGRRRRSPPPHHHRGGRGAPSGIPCAEGHRDARLGARDRDPPTEQRRRGRGSPYARPGARRAGPCYGGPRPSLLAGHDGRRAERLGAVASRATSASPLLHERPC